MKTDGISIYIGSPPNRTRQRLSFSASEVCTNHGKSGSKAPAQLRSADFLPDFRLSIVAELITEPKEGILESQVETPDRSSLQFIHDLLIGAPPFFPCGRASANVLGEICDGGNREQVVSLIGGEEWVDSVVEVREEEDVALGECVHKTGLIHAVERARFDLTDAIKKSLDVVQKYEKPSNLRILSHDELNKSAAALKTTDIKAIHRDRPLRLSFSNRHVVPGSVRQAWVSDDPLLSGVLLLRS